MLESKHILKSLVVSYIFATTCIGVARTKADPPQTGAQPAVAVSAPSITILPVGFTSGEKWEELKNSLIKRTSDQIYKVFRDRGFTIRDEAVVKAKLADLKIDLTDEEAHRKDNFFKVGDEMKSDYIVFFVITGNTQRNRVNLLVSTKEGEVTAKYWLLDVKNHEVIYSAKSETAKARPHADFGTATKGSDQQLTAADRVVPAALKDFLKKYPEVKH